MAERENSEVFLQYRGTRARPALEPGVLLAASLLRLSLLSDHPKGARRSASRQIGYSDRQSRRIYRDALGEPLEAFVRRMRLERAAGQLSVEDASIAVIAENAGYKSSAGFSKAFMKHFGCSATEFRILNRSAACVMPGYLVSNLGSCGLPKSVCLRIGPDESVTYLYDGSVFLGRLMPGGWVDWRLP
jgi:AraC-like DNA-binding protein